jgi:hypothetical protein
LLVLSVSYAVQKKSFMFLAAVRLVFARDESVCCSSAGAAVGFIAVLCAAQASYYTNSLTLVGEGLKSTAVGDPQYLSHTLKKLHWRPVSTSSVIIRQLATQGAIRQVLAIRPMQRLKPGFWVRPLAATAVARTLANCLHTTPL